MKSWTTAIHGDSGMDSKLNLIVGLVVIVMAAFDEVVAFVEEFMHMKDADSNHVFTWRCTHEPSRSLSLSIPHDSNSFNRSMNLIFIFALPHSHHFIIPLILRRILRRRKCEQ